MSAQTTEGTTTSFHPMDVAEVETAIKFQTINKALDPCLPQNYHTL
jgi:hypothetical protein